MAVNMEAAAPANAWDNDDIVHHWESRVAPHPLLKIYLRLIGLTGCSYLFYLSYCHLRSDAMYPIRCFFISHDRCSELSSATWQDFFAFFFHFTFYASAPIISFIGQLHHIIVWLQPSLWRRLPRRVFCKWHRLCYFSFYHALFITSTTAISNLLTVSSINGTDEAFLDFGVFCYMTASFKALWSFVLFFQFPMYARMTLLEEHLLSKRLAIQEVD